MCHIWHTYETHIPYIRETCVTYESLYTYIGYASSAYSVYSVYRDSYVTLYCDSYVTHVSYTGYVSFIYDSLVTHDPYSYVTHVLCSHVTHASHTGYGVATISRLLKNIGLFCKRDLQKRPIFCKETYIFKHPTHRSHPICK